MTMKKTYVAPVAEKIEFEYRDQVVVASGVSCEIVNAHTQDGPVWCTDPGQIQNHLR